MRWRVLLHLPRRTSTCPARVRKKHTSACSHISVGTERNIVNHPDVSSTWGTWTEQQKAALQHRDRAKEHELKALHSPEVETTQVHPYNASLGPSLELWATFRRPRDPTTSDRARRAPRNQHPQRFKITIEANYLKKGRLLVLRHLISPQKRVRTSAAHLLHGWARRGGGCIHSIDSD